MKWVTYSSTDQLNTVKLMWKWVTYSSGVVLVEVSGS